MPDVRGSSRECQAVTAGMSEKSYSSPRSGVAAKRRYLANEVRGSSRQELPHAPTPEARGGGREDQLHVQGAVAARAQEGLEELSQVESQEGQR